MPHEDRIGQSAWDYGTVIIIVIAALAVSPGNARVYGEELLSGPVAGTGRTILDRSTLTGDWWGVRDILFAHGVAFDVSLTQLYQGVTTGGKERDFDYGGKLDCYVNIDGGKAGLWPGFSVTTHVETRYGNDVNEIDGMFSLANFNMAFPKGENSGTGVTALKLTQRLFDHLLLIAGKINTLDDFRLNYTGGNGLDRFMNSAVVANVINGRTIPYSTYGAGFAVFADQGPEFTFLVRDPDNHPTTTDLNKLFAQGALLTGSLRLPVAPFGLPGTHVFGGNWSSRHYTSLDPSDWENVPGQGLPAPEESGSWAIWYNADQTLWINPANTNQWLGAFEMSGLSDGNPNSVRWNVTVGLGAGGLVHGRKHDTMGVAYFHIGVSDEVKDLLASQPGLAQRDEQGVDLYYNAALSPWCHLTADLQVAQPSTKAYDTAVLAGIRLKIDF